MKQNITKVVVAVVLFILLLCTITATTKYDKLKNTVVATDIRFSLLPTNAQIEPIYSTTSGGFSKNLEKFFLYSSRIS